MPRHIVVFEDPGRTVAKYCESLGINCSTLTATLQEQEGDILQQALAIVLIAALLMPFGGCSLASYPIPEVPVTPSPSTEDRQACA